MGVDFSEVACLNTGVNQETQRMTDFRLDAPPKLPGVYVAFHKPTSRFYIGATTNLLVRFNEWRMMVMAKSNWKSHRLQAIFQSTEPDEWIFRVVQVCATKEEAAAIETGLIEAAMRDHPELNLNLNLTGLARQRSVGNAAVAKSRILDDKGNTIPYPVAVKQLGCDPKTLAKRLANYRKRGLDEVPMALLLERSGKPGRPLTAVAGVAT
jgi:hypothetical protein